MKKIGPTMLVALIMFTIAFIGFDCFNNETKIKQEEIKVDRKLETNSNVLSKNYIEDQKADKIFSIIDEAIEEEKSEEEKKEEENKNDIQTNVETLEEELEPKVYDGLTMSELTQKLDRNLNSTLSGYGYLFASYSLALGLDPYLALAITLQETGCKWNCSTLVKQCNNVGGMKGSPGCNGGSYKAFNTLEEGIKSYLDNLYYNYYSIGLTTPELINPKYAESTEWSRYVNNYIIQIKAS